MLAALASFTPTLANHGLTPQCLCLMSLGLSTQGAL